LWIITPGAQATAPGEAVGILPSAAWGFGRSLALEHPALWGGLFDLDPQYDCDTAAAAILQHIAAGSDGDQAAIRGERLLVPRLVRAPEARARTRLTIRADAAYLITGGLGGLGLALAEWLVRAGARCLVLTRRPHPAGERASTPSSAAQSTALERLRRLGASVVIEAADAGNLDAMRAVIERIGLTLPPLRGVFHLAGVAEPKRILELTTTEIQTAFHAKALGAFNLHLLTRAYALDHFVLFSSAAAVWGSTGLAHYAAANQVLDALALHRISRGLSALSIEWGMWNEIGMAAGETAQQLGRSMGLRAMAPHHALSQLEALLRAPGGVYTVADVAWSDFKALFEADPRRRLLSAIELTSPSRIEWLASTDMRAVLRTLPFEAAVLRLEAELQAALAQSLGVSAEEVASDKSLDALGLDSLLVLELKTRFETSLGVSIPVMQLLGAASLRSVCVDLVSSLRSDAGATVHDLESEARLDESLRPHPSRKLATREHGTLLTGVTGFLGAALLAELLRTTDTPILCLVRAKDEAHARARIHAALRRYAPDSIGSERVVPVLGDLATERLGLDEGGLADVRARVSTIIHSGAWLNPVYSYAELRPTNVDGTRELLRLACSGSAMRVVHISSLAVFPWDRRSDGRRFAEASAPSPQGLPDGYCQTKWVAERLVEQAAERGLAAIIVRPGLVVGHSRTGIANDQDLLGRLIKGCVQMGCYPALSGKVDLTPVDYAARVIARLVHGATTSRFYHVTNPQWLEWTTLFEWIAELVPNLEAVSFDAWKQRLQMAPDGNVLRYLLPLLGLSEEMITGQRSFETCRTEHALEGTGISCPLPSRELVRSYARYYLRAH
jgi:thioester reductase-like protein